MSHLGVAVVFVQSGFNRHGIRPAGSHLHSAGGLTTWPVLRVCLSIFPDPTSGGRYSLRAQRERRFSVRIRSHWKMVTLQDSAGNIARTHTLTLRDRGFPTTLTVISTPDITPPQIQSLEFVPATMNLPAADTTVTVRMLLTDSQTGLGIEGPLPGCECIFELLMLVSPSGRKPRWISNTEFA
jgi:hypothetical protein